MAEELDAVEDEAPEEVCSALGAVAVVGVDAGAAMGAVVGIRLPTLPAFHTLQTANTTLLPPPLLHSTATTWF